MIELAFRKLHVGAVTPTRAHARDAGLDLCAIEQHEIAPGERAKVATGIAVAIPEGCAGLVMPRSGLASKHGISLVNAPGLIDAGYRGELQVLLLNTDRAETFVINPGDRIAQLVIVDLPECELVEVEQFDDTSRGMAGFGSTGR